MPHTTIDLPGSGTILQVKISAAFVTIPQCFEISWDGYSIAERNPTSLASNRVRKKPGLPNFGQIKFKIYFDPNDTTHIYLRDLITAGTPTTAIYDFKLIYPDGMTTPCNCVITGYLSEFNQSGVEPETGTLTAEGSISVDNAVWTAGV